MTRLVVLSLAVVLIFSLENCGKTCKTEQRQTFLPFEIRDTLPNSLKPNHQLFSGGLTRFEEKKDCDAEWVCSHGTFGCTGLSMQKIKCTVAVGSEQFEFELTDFQSFLKDSIANFCENQTVRLLKVEYK